MISYHIRPVCGEINKNVAYVVDGTTTNISIAAMQSISRFEVEPLSVFVSVAIVNWDFFFRIFSVIREVVNFFFKLFSC